MREPLLFFVYVPLKIVIGSYMICLLTYVYGHRVEDNTVDDYVFIPFSGASDRRPLCRNALRRLTQSLRFKAALQYAFAVP